MTNTPNHTTGPWSVDVDMREGGVMEIRAGANAHLKLRDIAANWNTPRSHRLPSMTRIAEQETKSRLENQDLIFQSSLQDQTTTPNGAMSYLDFLSLLPPSKKRLNPTFTEWLMGLPLGWTNPDTKSNYLAWEMQFRQLLQRLLSAYWQTGLE